MPSKWVTEASRIVLQDRWITLRADTCRREDGRLIDPYYVREYGEWTSMLALTPDGRVVTVREYRHGAGVSVPALPSGSVEDMDASAEAAAERELLEETGYRPGHVVSLGTAYANWANQNNHVHYFLGLECELVGRPVLDENEEIEVGLFDLDRVMAPGFLEQSFHLANLWLALPHLRESGLVDN
jgi:8-oxo-dGTP pyrophosphatase MutT (NUDIX family)